MAEKIAAKPRFIAFEGLDGSGKSTHAKLFCNRLNELSVPCVFNFEPTDQTIGRLIRQILSGEKKADPRTVALLFAADRIEHITGENGILENLKNGISVVSDRYYFSSYAYQTTAMPLEWVMSLNSQAKEIAKPDCHIFIDISPETCLERIYKDRKTTSDIFENKKSLTAARDNFMRIFEMTAKDEKVIIIDGNDEIEAVSKKVFDSLKPLFF